MNPKEQIPKPEESLESIDADATSSVDDFIKELEAKEKDLQITADLTIEIEEPEFDPNDTPEFIQQELAATQQNGANASSPKQPGMKTRLYELETEVRALEERVKGLRAERNDIQEKSDRRLKDFENYKYRMDRERRGAFIDQISNLATQMLPVLDNLERALSAANGFKADKTADFQQFYDGIVLVNQQVNEVLSGMGVQPIATVGETFDPNFHEAVAAEDRDDLPPNAICEEMLRGYRIGNRVIRHSMVKVSAATINPKRDAAASPARQLADLSPPDNDEPAPDQSQPEIDS